MGAATLSVFTAFPATAIAGSDDDIEMLKQQNAEMKEMMMRMQQQIQELAIKANAVEHAAAKEGKKRGRVASKKENIVVSTTGGGIKVKSSNGNKFKIGGSVQLDHDSFDEFWGGGDVEDDEIRRSRLALSGASGKSWSYKFVIDIDHEGEAASVDTGMVQYAAKPFYIRAGKFKRPGMLEARTSSKWINTIERSIINELAGGVLSKPDFGGISLKYVSQGEGLPMSAELGIYDDDELGEDDRDDIFGVGARISVAPQFNDSFLHLGASYYRADYDGNSFRMRSRMGVHTADRIFDTENHLTDDVDQYGLEAAYAAGPFSLIGEYMVVESDGTAEEACVEVIDDSADNDFGTPTCFWHRDMEMDGFYIQAAYTLTGEALGYSPAGGNFSGIRPKGRQGAWELVVQYADASLELPGLGIDASADSLVLGVNWYATRNVKIALNYIDSEVSDCMGTAPYTNDDGNEDFADLNDLGSCGTGRDGVIKDGDAYSLRLQYAF